MTRKQEFDMLRDIIQAVMGVDIKNKMRKRDYVYGRMVFYVIMRSKGHTQQMIGNYVYKDHATVLCGVRKFYELVTVDKYLRDVYTECSKSFNEGVNPNRVFGNAFSQSLTEELQSRIDSLILENGKLQNYKSMHIRFKNILKEMHERTPHDMEDVLHMKIKEMFNGGLFK